MKQQPQHIPDHGPKDRDTSKYFDDFASMDDLLDEVADFTRFTIAMKDLADRWNFGDFVEVHRDKIIASIRQSWDIVEADGRIYMYRK